MLRLVEAPLPDRGMHRFAGADAVMVVEGGQTGPAAAGSVGQRLIPGAETKWPTGAATHLALVPGLTPPATRFSVRNQ